MKHHLIYDQKYCSGCLRCELACSWAYTKCFQPSSASIRVEARGEEYHVVFTENCKACGLCADSCLFNALIKTPEEEME